MKRMLFVSCCMLIMQCMFAQQKKIPLGLAANQRFILLKTSSQPDGFRFIGRITTQIANGYIDSLVEVNTDKELAVKNVNKFFLGNNLSTAVDETLKSRYPDLFNKPDYTVGVSPKVKVEFGGGLKKLNNKFSVIPVTNAFHQPTLSYQRRNNAEATTDLVPIFGTNVKEVEGKDFSYGDAAGNYFTVLDIYLDKGEDEGKQSRKYYVLKFGPTGTLDNADSLDFPIKRYPYSKNIVVNNKNEFKGIAYLFHVYPMTLKRKPSDSTDLQYYLVYVNEKGKIVYNNSFYFGEKKFDIDPMLVRENEGKLELMTISDYDSTHCLQFDNAGHLQQVLNMPLSKKQLFKERPTLMDFFAIQTYVPVYSFTDKNGETFCLVRQYAPNKAETGVYENSYMYGKFYYFKIRPDKSVAYLQSFADISGVAPANALPQVIGIQSNGDFCDILMKNPFNDAKVIWRLGDPKCPDIAPGIPAPAQLTYSTESIARVNDSEYYVAGYNAGEIILNKITMKLGGK